MLEKLTAGKLKGRLILGRRTGLAIFKNVTLFQILNFPLEKLHFYFTRLKKSRPFLWDFWNFFWRSCTFTELETFLRVILGDSLIPISDERCTNQCTNWPAPVVIGVGARCFQDLGIWRLRLTVETSVENVLVGQRTMEVLQQSRDICEILFLVPQVIAAVRAGRCLLWRNYNRPHGSDFRIWLLLSMFWQMDIGILHILHNSSIKWNLSVLSLDSLHDRSGPIVHLVGILFWKLTGGAIETEFRTGSPYLWIRPFCWLRGTL